MGEDSQELEQVEIIGSSIVEQLTRGEVDMQVATAKRYPRSIKEFKQSALSMAIKTPEIARKCFYIIPRAGKKIEGPSIRLAEVVAISWGNLRCEARVLGADAKIVTAQATAWDMQANVMMRREVQRKICDKNGNRFSEDMVVVTGNAAAAIALRNAIFTVVPMAYVSEIFAQCKRVAQSEGGGIDVAKENWMKYFAQRGVSQERVLEMLEKKGLEDVDLEDITTLQGLSTALAEGQTTIELTFGAPALENGTKKFGFKAKKEEAAKLAADAKKAEQKDEPAATDQPPDEVAPHRRTTGPSGTKT